LILIMVRMGSPLTVSRFILCSRLQSRARRGGGARGSAWPALAAFFAGAIGKDIVDVALTQLAPQAGGVNVDNNMLFPYGTTAVTFGFRDASNNVGAASASVTVILGQPKITAKFAGQGTLADGPTYVDVSFSNTGSGNARQVRIALIALLPLKGSGKITLVSPSLPDSLGNLDVGASQTVRIVMKVPPTVKQVLVGEAGVFVNVQNKLGAFVGSQTIVP